MADQQAHIATLVNRAFNMRVRMVVKNVQRPATTMWCHVMMFTCSIVAVTIGRLLNVCYFFLYITSVKSIKPDVMKVLH